MVMRLGGLSQSFGSKRKRPRPASTSLDPLLPSDDILSLVADLKRQQSAAVTPAAVSAAKSQASRTPPVQPDGVPLDVFDGLGVLPQEEEDALLARSSIRNGVFRATTAVEAARHRGVAGLAKRFSVLCEKALGKKWYTHFEAWLLSRRAAQPPVVPDPCLPGGACARTDPELTRKLQAAGVSQEEAVSVCDTLGRTAARALQTVARTPSSLSMRVRAEPFLAGKDQCDKIRLSCGGVHVEVNRVHYQKLKELFRRNRMVSTAGELVGGGNQGCNLEGFEEAAFCLLARYSSLQGTHYRGGGFQAAIHSECFDVLREDMGVMLECFASPLNCRWSRFCSAFADTDAPFGSLGSFFELTPEQGSFEANPPFDDDVIHQMLQHMNQLLTEASRYNSPMSFVIIIPQQQDKKGWTAVSRNKFLKHHLLLTAGKHGYKEGAQHNRANTHRTSCHNTSVFFLQSEAGAAKWPVTKIMLERLEAAFNTKQAPGEKALNKETKANKLRDIKQGRAASLWGAEAPACPSDTERTVFEHDESEDNIPNNEGKKDKQELSELSHIRALNSRGISKQGTKPKKSRSNGGFANTTTLSGDLDLTLGRRKRKWAHNTTTRVQQMFSGNTVLAAQGKPLKNQHRKSKARKT